jgi:hypothetical protein
VFAELDALVDAVGKSPSTPAIAWRANGRRRPAALEPNHR